MRRLWALTVVAVLLTGCGSEPPPRPTGVDATAGTIFAERLRVEVLETYPHDTQAFTQGLELDDGLLYEGTGLEGWSELRAGPYETGELIRRVALPGQVFGEGITVVGDRVWQLTWQNGIAYQWDKTTFAPTGQAEYEGEGWGLCYDGTRLVMSDGSNELTFRDPETFEATGSVAVTLDGSPLAMLNELECVDDRVWANVWQTDEIVRIDPATGVVEAIVDASGLLTEQERASADVLNGIAAVDDGTFLITGKWWPHLFLVRFVPSEGASQTPDAD